MSKATPNVIVSSLLRAMQEDDINHAESIRPQTSVGPIEETQAATPGASFSEKIYIFPDSYNALRRELHDFWPTLWPVAGYCMAHKSDDFVEVMNIALDLRLQYDTARVDTICKIYLDALRKLRGLAPLNSDVSFGVI